jgi:NAD(P)-dependent dehydrogenase (short-subunit alcohol dehydrogenase family)
MRSVLITGTSIGIGRATAVVLASRGWRVFATMRKLQKRSLLEQALKEAGVGAFARLKSFSEGLDPKPPAAESNEALFGTSAVAWSAIFASDSLCGL